MSSNAARETDTRGPGASPSDIGVIPEALLSSTVIELQVLYSYPLVLLFYTLHGCSFAAITSVGTQTGSMPFTVVARR